ncbi:MAG: hypothetical protein CSA65_03965 [Proteobacteria bacterium]|nr:MAG: hypothetical protein CSB49_05920 [Pseudomonadota bacterium]PIE18797.1 MAG: hypothetical protein CSA65_03965 [Pseudomonadota bacterium]
MAFVGYQNGEPAFAVAWRDNVFGGAVWARRYIAASGNFASSVMLEASTAGVAVATNWVRRMGFDPYCQLSPSGCGMAIWQVSNNKGWALHWRQITPYGLYGPIREQVGFRGSGEVGCRGHIEALECTRLLAYIERDDRPNHPDRLWIARLDATGSVIPPSRLSIYEVAKPVRLFQTAVVYSSAEQRFLVA